MSVDNRGEVSDFLSSRRARISPEQAGLPAWSAGRRVPGLRREEVALLAGVSFDYYVRLERGNLAGASEQVLEAVANALQLDEAERSHLFDLARAASARGPRSAPRRRVRPPVQWLLDAMDSSAAYVRDARTDLLAANRLGRALYAPVYAMPGRPNVARFLFLDPHASEFFVEWDKVAADPGLRLNAYVAEPGTASAEAFSLLASWAGSPQFPDRPGLDPGSQRPSIRSPETKPEGNR